MRIRETFYTAIVLIVIGAFMRNEYGAWVMTVGGCIIFGIGLWKFLKILEGVM